MSSRYPLSAAVAACLLAGCAQVGAPTFGESGPRVQANPPGFSPGNFVVSEAEWQRVQNERAALATAVTALRAELAALREQVARKEAKTDAQPVTVAQVLNGSEPASRTPAAPAAASARTVTEVARLFAPRRPVEAPPAAQEAPSSIAPTPARGAAPAQPDGATVATITPAPAPAAVKATLTATAPAATRLAQMPTPSIVASSGDAWESAATGAPAGNKPAAPTQAGHKAVFSALFKFAQTSIDLDIRDALRGKKDALVAAPRIELRAFADPIGKRDLNEQIASGRALAVKKELEAMGVPGDRIKVSTTVTASAPEGSEILGLFRPEEFRARRVDIALMASR